MHALEKIASRNAEPITDEAAVSKTGGNDHAGAGIASGLITPVYIAVEFMALAKEVKGDAPSSSR
jgi:hypothetical protein